MNYYFITLLFGFLKFLTDVYGAMQKKLLINVKLV
jgi:hypothetical protein